MECSGKVGSELGGKNEVVVVGWGPRSTVDAVDLGFKLSSHVESPLSILTHGTPIRNWKFY